MGVLSGLAAAAWLGAAEAPTKLVISNFSPLVISAVMVLGVFVARWTVPTLVKGTTYVWYDLKEKLYLVTWALIAGALWAVANALTVFAISDVGLSIAFPIWNANCLVGLFWGWLLFGELRGSRRKDWIRVVGGALLIVAGTAALSLASADMNGGRDANTLRGVAAALGAALMFGTMYVPYRKAYISGMNPLSFVTAFTLGELTVAFLLAGGHMGGASAVIDEMARMRPQMFWVFLGGFFWVLGDLFQQFAAKYLGIGRGIPLSNVNQLFGLAWGALVFGELAGSSGGTLGVVIAGSCATIAGAAAIGFAEPQEGEREHWDAAILRECRRYGLSFERIKLDLTGTDEAKEARGGYRWWDFAIVLVAVGIFVSMAWDVHVPDVDMDFGWIAVIFTVNMVLMIWCGVQLKRKTGFS